LTAATGAQQRAAVEGLEEEADIEVMLIPGVLEGEAFVRFVSRDLAEKLYALAWYLQRLAERVAYLYRLVGGELLARPPGGTAGPAPSFR
jgi:hypothetical protein